jgi:hypothetical protein
MGIGLLKIQKRLARHMAGLSAAWRDSGVVARTHGIGRLGMLAEAAGLLLRGRMAPDTYFHYRFFDRQIQRKDTYISEAPAANDRLWATLTPSKYRTLYDNKYVFQRMFAGFPLARLHGVFDERFGFTFDGQKLRNAVELDALMRRLPDGFVFKPVEGIRGHLTLVFAPPVNGQFATLSGERYDADRIVREARDTAGLRIQNKGVSASSFMIEERLRPHSALQALLGPTFCTARVLTVIRRDGSPDIVGSVFKLQADASGVDHLRFGAIASWIDAEGTLGPGRTKTSLEWLQALPNGRKFVGFRLPHWERVKQLAIDAASTFPWARAIGWDIGICEDGPRLVEGNERWSPSLVQLPAPHGIMDGEFKAVYDELRTRT